MDGAARSTASTKGSLRYIATMTTKRAMRRYACIRRLLMSYPFKLSLLSNLSQMTDSWDIPAEY